MKNIIFIFLIFLFSILNCSDAIIEEEPNDRFKYPGRAVFSKKMRGSFQSLKDVDVYAYPVKEASIIEIKVSGLKGTDIFMEVFTSDTDGTPLFSIDKNPEQIHGPP